jgi:hypothetical protein
MVHYIDEAHVKDSLFKATCEDDPIRTDDLLSSVLTSTSARDDL